MLHFVVIINIVLLFVGVMFLYRRTRVLYAAALSVTVFWIMYCVISGLFFVFDKFSFYNVLIFQSVLSVLWCLFCIRNNEQGIVFLFDKTDMWLLGLLLMALPFTLAKFEVFSTGQDQGLYQAEAIELYMGNYDVQHDFEEYQLLSDDDKHDYMEMVNKNFVGFYPLSMRQWPTVKASEIKSDVSGMYHGVQTFPAILGLSGMLFGLENMVDVQTIFLLCSIIFIYYIIYNLGIPIWQNIVMTLLFELSPLVIWVSKSSFTEMYLTLLMSIYLYFLMDKKNLKLKWLMGLPLLAFAYTHVSFLLLVPAFVIVNFVLYINEKNKQYLYVNVMCAVGLSSGYYVMSIIAPQYFFDNCSRLYYKSIVTKENFLIWIYALSCIIIISSFVLHYACIEKIKKYINTVYITKLLLFVSLISLSWMIIYGIGIGYLKNPEHQNIPWLFQYYGKGVVAFQHLSLYAFAMAMGFVALPIIIGAFIKNAKVLNNDIRYFSIGLLFVYMVIIQSAFIRKEVNYYYYYSRYLVFYLPIVSVMGAVLLRSCGKTLWFFLSLSFVPMLIFDQALVRFKDDTYYEWEVLTDLQRAVEDNSAIILESETIQNILGPQVRAITKSSIFPVFRDLEKELELLNTHYDNVYFLSDDGTWTSDDPFLKYKDDMEVVYRDRYLYSKAAINSNKGIYPLEFTETEMELVLYQYYSDEYKVKYDMGAPTIYVQNGRKVSNYIESTGEAGIVAYGPYCTMNSGKYTLRAYIEVLETSKDSPGNFTIYSEYGNDIIFPSTDISKLIKRERDKSFIEVVFDLGMDKENIEFVVSATEKSKFKLYSYIIYKTEENKFETKK